ncbi:SCY1-like protein 2 [Frankliniella fusca]|uniref:SCY1-like protein 2 n=1 Tax=Frankliniella fusca TaxID=407009 RepID=A0AAE1I2F4_9NEOP|nr:SCY1-like protein 2 [Frankliniella fusca]
MLMANITLGLPLRKCSAVPKDDPQFPAMDSNSFRILKRNIADMWVSASYLFTSGRTDSLGWGLFVSDDYQKNERSLTSGKPIALGWIAKAPSPDDSTHHRYLRSPCICGTDSSLYLGGPISLANYDTVDMVKCTLSISTKKHLANTMLVSRAPKIKLIAGDEVLWTYNISSRERLTGVQFFHEKEWKLKCCSELGGPVLIHTKIRRHQPLKQSLDVKGFRPCTYCGKNLAEAAKPGSKINLKCHLALKHATELCNELNGDDKEPAAMISPQLFIKHLDHNVNVYNTLHNMNYKVVPACKFFDLVGTSVLPPDASQEEKDLVYQAFEEEGRQAFRKYQVLYLRGISRPTKYEDLLVPADSSYSNVNWAGSRPSNSNFSLSQYTLSENEHEEHAMQIKLSVMKAVVMWMNGKSG